MMQGDTQLQVDAYIGHKYKDGRLRIQHWIRKMLERQGLLQHPLSAWDDQYHTKVKNGNGELKSPLRLVTEWLISLLGPAPRPWLVLIGKYGLGKTQLARLAGVMYAVRNSATVGMVNWASFLKGQHRKIELSKRNAEIPEELRDEDIYQYAMFDFLIIDDVGTGTIGASAWALDMLFSLIEMREDKPTIITSNIDLCDRIVGGKYIQSNYRLMMLSKAAALRSETDKTTYRDLVNKVADRFATGAGGLVHKQIPFSALHGSYRQKGTN